MWCFSSQNSSCRDSEQGRSGLISASPQGTWGLLLYICSQGWAPPCRGPGSADSHSQLFNRFGTSSSGLCPLWCSTSQVTPSLTALMASLEPWLGQESPQSLSARAGSWQQLQSYSAAPGFLRTAQDIRAGRRSEPGHPWYLPSCSPGQGGMEGPRLQSELCFPLQTCSNSFSFPADRAAKT